RRTLSQQRTDARKAGAEDEHRDPSKHVCQLHARWTLHHTSRLAFGWRSFTPAGPESRPALLRCHVIRGAKRVSEVAQAPKSHLVARGGHGCALSEPFESL